MNVVIYSFILKSIVKPYLIKYQEKINVFYFNKCHFKDFQDSQLKDCELKPRKSLARLEPGSARPQPSGNPQNNIRTIHLSTWKSHNLAFS